MYRNKGEALYLKLYCFSKSVSDKWISKEEIKCLEHRFMHFSDDDNDNSVKYMNWTEIFFSFSCS